MAFRTLTRWYGRLFNNRVARRLRSTDHEVLSANHLLITMTGRRSGNRLTIPVNYRAASDDTLIIGTEAPWWHNLEGGADVELVVAGASRRGHATPIVDVDDAEKRATAGRLIAGFTWPMFANSLVLIEIKLLDLERPHKPVV